MVERKLIYYYLLLGAAGGLTAWYLAEFSLNDPNQPGQRAISGALIGGLIGMAIASYNGSKSGSWRRYMRFGGIGLILGGLTGALALALAQLLYGKISGQQTVANLSAPQSILIGLACWLLLGGMIGVSAVFNTGTQIYKGLLGGLVGAVLGGLIYEIARVENLGQSSWVKAISLGLLGGAIGASVGLITAPKHGWLEVANGSLQGRIYDITKFIDPRTGRKSSGLIGSDANAAWIYLPGDPKILPRHAEIHYADGAPTLTVFQADKKASMPTQINGQSVNTSIPLRDGDRVQIGGTTLVYHQKSR